MKKRRNFFVKINERLIMNKYENSRGILPRMSGKMPALFLGKYSEGEDVE